MLNENTTEVRMPAVSCSALRTTHGCGPRYVASTQDVAGLADNRHNHATELRYCFPNARHAMNISRYPEAFEPYRYALTVEFADRNRGPNNGHLIVIMHNPATIHEGEDLILKRSGTRRRLVKFASDNQYRALTELNLFAYRSPKKTLLAKAVRDDGIEPVGPENDRVISDVARQADKLFVAWGKVSDNPTFAQRVREVTQLLDSVGKPLYCLGKNDDGSPTQPTFGRYAIQSWP